MIFNLNDINKKSKLRDDIIAIIHEALSKPNYEGTWYKKLDVINGNRWAIALSWMDYDNTNEYELYAKVTYQPSNSIMQCDYDIDWIMPYDEGSGCVYDTEIWITNIDFDEDYADWLLEQWEMIRKEISND